MFGPNFWLHGHRNAAMFYWSHYTRAVRIKLKNTTDLFYRLGSILVTFLVIYLWFIYKVIEYNSISPRDLQVQADLVCGARSLVMAWDKLFFSLPTAFLHNIESHFLYLHWHCYVRSNTKKFKKKIWIFISKFVHNMHFRFAGKGSRLFAENLR